MALSKDDILNAIAEMSVMDVVELVSAMEEKFGVSAAAAVAAAPVQAALVSVEPTVDPALLEGLRAQVADAEKLAAGAKKAPKLVRSGRAAELKAEAVEKAEVLKKMEVVAATPAVVVSAPAPEVKVALNVFDQAVVILSVGTDILKISKW